MRLKRGDHVCAVYSTTAELTREVAAHHLAFSEFTWLADVARSSP
jgi:hypothetical protein